MEDFGFWFLVCYAATQLAIQVQGATTSNVCLLCPADSSSLTGSDEAKEEKRRKETNFGLAQTRSRQGLPLFVNGVSCWARS